MTKIEELKKAADVLDKTYWDVCSVLNELVESEAYTPLTLVTDFISVKRATLLGAIRKEKALCNPPLPLK